MKRHLLVLFWFLCGILHFLFFQQNSLHAYTPAPSCPDFTDLNGAYVEAFTGTTDNPFAKQGIVDNRHILITEQGVDSTTGGLLPLLPPGETSVIRLGNKRVGAQAEALKYHFTVEAANPVLLLKFAVVLEDPNHLFSAQPRFVVRITDKNGNLLEDCAEYDVSAGAGVPGFQTYSDGYSSIRWRPWTNVGLDMTKFVGQEVQVQFITYDCAWYGHFGYAYFTAHCLPAALELQNCNGGNFTVEAPDNFESYLWDNGDKSRITTRSIAAYTDTSIMCIVTSATGCSFPLYAYINSVPPSSGNIYKDTICEGEQYNKYNFHLPAQQAGQKYYRNTCLDVNTCNDDIADELMLTVLQKYQLIKASICQGDDYTDNGFNIIQPAAGIRYDTLVIEQNKYCGNIQKILKLTINPNAAPLNAIQGEISPCAGEQFTYSFEGADAMTEYTWKLPDNAVTVQGKYTSSITLYFTDSTPCDIILNSENGCGMETTTLHITPHQSYHFYFSENICMGEEYSVHGFNLGIQNKTGYFVHNKELKTVNGCDSSVTLALTVSPAVQAYIQLSDSLGLLCNAGDSVSLFATGDTLQIPNTGVLDSNKIFISDCSLEYLWNTGDTTAAITVNPPQTTTCSVKITTSNGCSSSESKTVVVKDADTLYINDSICAGKTYTDYGFNESMAGTHIQNITQNGCTQRIELTLSLMQPLYRTVTGSICDGHTFTEEGLNYTLYGEGLFSDTLHYLSKSTGCDSIIYVNIQINLRGDTVFYDTVCEGQTYTENGFALPAQNAEGEYSFTRNLINTFGCDSTVILYLSVNPQIENIISDEDTLGKHYQRYGFDTILTAAGLQTYTNKNLQTIYGCDSSVTLNLKVIAKAALDTNLYDTICAGQTILLNGAELSEAGTYIDTVSDMYGNDSIIIYLHLEVKALNERDVNANICQGDIFDFYGKQLTLSGIYTDTISGSNCDTVIRLDLTVYPAYSQNESISVSETELPYTYKDTVFDTGTASGIYTFRYITVNGCDSTVTLNLEVIPPALELELLPVADICAGEDSLRVEYNITEGNIKFVSVIFDERAQQQGLAQIKQSANGNSIAVPLPQNIRPDKYSAIAIFENYSLIKEFPFEFNILYPASVMQQKWNNVIAVKNASFNGGYDFSDYIWYLNDEQIISSINRGSYIYTGEKESLQFGQQYKVLLTRMGENYGIFTCPLIPYEHIALTEYPTVVTEDRKVIIFPAKSGASVKIWTASGLMLGGAVQNSTSDRITVPLNTGFYFIEILESDGRRFVEKVIIY